MILPPFRRGLRPPTPTGGAYGRGFNSPRENLTEVLLWLLCAFVLMAIFIAGIWYVWPENGVPQASGAATHPELVP